MAEFFTLDKRLGIPLPDLRRSWDQYSPETQQEIMFGWEQICGTIPDRIKELENSINHKQASLFNESNFARSCKLNNEIADLASIINDLWLWYRAGDVFEEKVHH